jgi:ABC-type transporter Mla subunit MlaD
MLMGLNPRTRVHKLCSRALGETDPKKLAVLLNEIDDILSESVAELRDMLQEVEQVLKKMGRPSRIHLT